MAMGQGATMALPIFAYYMKKVYADKDLGISESDKFDMPEGFDPCATAYDDESMPGLDEGSEEVFE